jgi:hypothetical protein
MPKEPSLQELQGKFEFYDEIVSVLRTADNAHNVYYQYSSAIKSGLTIVSLLKADAFLYLYFYHFQHVLTKMLAYFDTKASFHKQIFIRNAIVTLVDLDLLNNFIICNTEWVHTEWKKAKTLTVLGSDDMFDDLIKELRFIYKIIHNNYSTMNFFDPKTELCIAGPIQPVPETKKKPSRKKYSKEYKPNG